MLLPLQGEITNINVHRAMPYAIGLLAFQAAYRAKPNIDNKSPTIAPNVEKVSTR